jgi:hypothetical protein
MNDLTEWYPGDIKPIRIGIYQRKRNGIVIYSFWDGKEWKAGGETIRDALRMKVWIAVYQDAEWRGVVF